MGNLPLAISYPLLPSCVSGGETMSFGGGGARAGGYRLPAQNENPKSQRKSCSPIPLLLRQIRWLTKNLSLLCV